MKFYRFRQDEYSANGGRPPIGEEVICIYENKIFAGEVIHDAKETWAVKTPSGKVIFPFGSDCIKNGSTINQARAYIE